MSDKITIDGQFGGSRITVSGPDDDGDLQIMVEDRDEHAEIYLSVEAALDLIGDLAARLAEAQRRTVVAARVPELPVAHVEGRVYDAAIVQAYL